MSLIFQKLAAGISAAVCLFSAVGSDIAGVRVSRGASSGVLPINVNAAERWGAHGNDFSSEQDTYFDGAHKLYNTEQGLHTDKTATAVDGRTFDLDLESWYSGSNPVDLGLVLDASGSMAWTTKDLQPLDVEKALADSKTTQQEAYSKVIEKYGLTTEDGGVDNEGNITLKGLQTLQEQNGNFLPEDVAELIVNPNYTDDSKLDYNYRYYVYEDRDDVSEFSPLGFWQGSNYALADLENNGLIGYYPFEHSLDNAVDNKPETTASVVNENFEALTTGPALVTFIDPTASTPDDFKTVSLKDTLENCALLADAEVPPKFTIAFRLKFLTEGSEETPIVYIGDLNGTDYAEIVQSGSTLVLRTSKGGSVSLDFKTDASGWKNFHLTYDGTDLVFSGNSIDDTTSGPRETLPYTFGSEKRIIIGGDRDGHSGTYSDIGLTDLVVYNTVLTESQLLELDGKKPKDSGSGTEAAIKHPDLIGGVEADLTGWYTFDGTDVETGPSPENKLGGKGITLINQPGDGKAFSTEEAAQIPVDAVYAEVAGTCLDLNATQSAGEGGNAVLLDAVPDDLSNFTVSFRLRRVGSAGERHNLFYAGAKDQGDYFQFFRSGVNGGYLELSHGAPKDETKGEFFDEYMYYQGGISNPDTWYTNTLVFKTDADGKFTVTPYIDGKAEYQDDHFHPGSLDSITVEEAALLLGALADHVGNTPVYVDDVYVFDRALDEGTVAEYFSMPDCTDANEEKKDEDTQKMPSRFMTHASDKNGTEFAQVTREVYRNRDKNRGWYYVNTASSWIELVECLHGEKQYMGWKALSTVSTVDDTATIPSAQRDEDGNFVEDGYGQSIEDGNTTRTFALPSGEQSNPFYVDQMGHLRTIVVTGTDDNHVDCSLVYENPPEGENHSELKYQTLNRALNEFFDRLYLSSGDSNVSVLRFSIEKMFAAQYNSERGIDNPETWLRHLAMKRWLNVGQKHGELKDLVTKGTGEQEYKYNGYAEKDDETDTYNYVLTGGTNTWTGLRAFYEQNIEGAANEPLKNNTHGKYLIVFTDGRDTSKVTATKNYVGCGPDGPVDNEAQLARLWANKIKEAGYTIYGVMLSTGSISATANPETFKAAHYRLKQLVGYDVITEDTIDLTDDAHKEQLNTYNTDPESDENKYIKVATTTETDGLIKAFQDILNDILKELDGNIVQDYIDPRFDLVDKDNNVYHLGPDGNVTVVDKNGKELVEKSKQAQSAIGCTSLEEAQSKGIPFTPRESRTYVNKEGQDTTDADPYLYYDSEKGMYYLRWYGLKIGGASQAFTTGLTNDYGTDESGNVYLSDKAWYSTIRIKAKEDFIGGNAILTNGNEPGMNLVFNAKSIYGENGETPVDDERQTLQDLSGTDNAFFGTSNDINTTASKGFPRTTVNVRLLPINTKELYDVVYLGEVIDPVEMLGEIEDDYLTDSYYLEYLKRYAARLYERQSSEDLIDLLNAWLQIDVENVTSRTFTIPYIYLPNPTYNSETGEFQEYANSFGAKTDGTTHRADYDDSNLRDIVGYLTYTWTRVDPPSGDEYPKYPTDPKEKFIVETTDRISYNLKLQYTPLKQGGTPQTPIGDKFVPEGDKFFQVADGDFASGGTWTYYTRDVLNKALVNENPRTAPDSGEYYEWDSGYKPSVGTAQIETTPEGLYGSAQLNENKDSLVANTPYIKDPVNGALALEITINDTDLSILTKDGTEEITLPFTRTYKDPHSDNPAVSDTDVNADVKDEQYDLTFTVDAGSAVDSATQSGKHTVIGVLSKIERGGQELTPVQLPIGTYISGSCEGVMFCGRFLQIDGVETDSTKFKFEYFPKDVYDVNENAAAANEKADPEYLLNNNGTDYSPANMADSKSIQDEGQDTPLSGVFNLGTADSSGNKGKHLDADDENSREYTKDRLGILKLSTQGAQLPSAGGEGTFPIMLCGLALLAAGGTALLLRKRKARSEAGGDADG